MFRMPEFLAPQLGSVADLVRSGRRGLHHEDLSYVVAIDGAVSVGKSTTAHMLAALLGVPPDALVVHVASTDGYLYPNSVLTARGLLMRKGFPESYDVDALVALVQSVRDGDAELRVRVYSHERYDVLDAPEVFARPQVLVLEGLHTTTTLAGVADLTVYVDAAESDIVRWYEERFVELAASARTGFYARFAGLPETELLGIARDVWDAINAPNLHEYILPGRDRADVVITKGPDHAVTHVTLRE